MVRANGGKPTSQTYFPILENAPSTAKEEQSFAKKVKGMAEEAVDLIRAIKPYKGGDNVLWTLHRLSIIDKHRLLVTVGGVLANWGISQHIAVTNPPLDTLERMPRLYASPAAWTEVRKLTFPLKTGDEILRDFPGAKLNKKIKFEIDVAINEYGICEGDPLVAVLRAVLNRVLRTVARFDGLY